MAKLGGSSKVGLAIIRMEERSNREVVVERQERAGRAAEPANRAAHLLGLENVVRNLRVSEILRHCEVLRLGNVSKFLTVFEIVLVQL